MSLPASVQQLVDAIANGRLTNAAIAPAIRDAGGRDFVLFSAIRELAASSGGGSGNPQSAWFTWTSSGLGPGIFITDDPSLASTTSIVFAAVDGGGNSASNIFGRIPPGAALVITGADGVPIYAQINTVATDGGGNVTFAVGNMSGNAGDWSAQKYVVTVAAGPASAAFGSITGAPADNTNLANALTAAALNGSGASGIWQFKTGGSTTPANGVITSADDFAGSAAFYINSNDFQANSWGFPASNQLLLITLRGLGSGSFSIKNVVGFVQASPMVGFAATAQSNFGAFVDGEQVIVSFMIMPTLAQILAFSSITPAADGTVTPVTSETTQSGIVTALS